MDLLFVYGTLMPGEALWPALEPFAVAWRPASAAGRIWDTGLGYPAVRFDAGAGPVPGVVVDLDPERAGAAISLLDGIEEEGRLYRRVEVVTTGGPAYAYEWLGPTEGLTPLPEGWRSGENVAVQRGGTGSPFSRKPSGSHQSRARAWLGLPRSHRSDT